MLGFAFTEDEDKVENKTATKLVYKLTGMGNIIAAILSWEINHSIAWAIFHSALSWFYVGWWYYQQYIGNNTDIVF